MKLSFIGDIMLGRFVADKYNATKQSPVSEDILNIIRDSDCVIANLESPVVNCESDDSLKFAGSSVMLDEFKWVDCFSLSNNHINDFGTKGMYETISILDSKGIMHNGLFQEKYEPFIFGNVAVITCADMMNYEFDEDCPLHTLRVNAPYTISECIKDCKSKGLFTILFAHVGMLFTRFPNPPVRDFLHDMADAGADCIVTSHSHCLGCFEDYKGTRIFHSLGDFLMDGSSFRRRRSCVLKLTIIDGNISDWSVTPTMTDMNLRVILPDSELAGKMMLDFNKVSSLLSDNSERYGRFYKRQYKKEMLAHSMSTISFEFKKRGFWGLMKILWIRMSDILGMIVRVFTDRSTMSYDSDAIDEDAKFSNKEIQ